MDKQFESLPVMADFYVVGLGPGPLTFGPLNHGKLVTLL